MLYLEAKILHLNYFQKNQEETEIYICTQKYI